MILRQEYLDDFKDRLDDEPETTFAGLSVTKSDIPKDDDLMTRLWAVYQKNIEEYDCDAEWSFCDAVHEVLGVKNPAWNY